MHYIIRASLHYFLMLERLTAPHIFCFFLFFKIYIDSLALAMSLFITLDHSVYLRRDAGGCTFRSFECGADRPSPAVASTFRCTQ
jgi:hypothetical protein